MRTIEIKTDDRNSRILVGETLQNLENYLPGKNTVIVTDTNLKRLYGNRFPNYPVVEIGLGEKNKTVDTLNQVFGHFVDLEVDRSTFILAIGGGIVCDVAGFAASVFMRGLRFGFVSTTLLSQVDASVGGKNGVNFQRYKNMIGVFNQPEFVICDTSMLKTLVNKEFRAGFAEIVKAGIIKSSRLFEFLEKNWQKALQYEPDVIDTLVYDSVMIKAGVVEADEKEKGERRKLNFGHTFAHSFEKLSDLLHGEAVSIGMVLASNLSVRMGFLAKDQAERIKRLLIQLGLPVTHNLDRSRVFEAMKQDKKREGDSIHMVLIDKIGNAIIHKVTFNKLEEMLNDMRSDF